MPRLDPIACVTPLCVVTPKLFEVLIEELADRELTELVRRRLAQKDTAIEVDIDQI